MNTPTFLTALTLSVLTADLTAQTEIQQRITSRDFPSIFQAWNPADNLKGEERLTTEARHDLLFHAPDFFGLRWASQPVGAATSFTQDSIKSAMSHRRELLKKNPNMILLCEIRYRDAHRSFLSSESKWWLKDENGQTKVGWAEGDYLLLDFSNPSYQQHVAKRAKAALDTGVFDGIMLDWWHEDKTRITLLKTLRNTIGEEPLILVNANDLQSPKSAPYVNGHFMECYRSADRKDWDKIAASLTWAENNLRKPRINCLETWFKNSRNDFNRMRATTAMALTLSDGYVLFSDPNPLSTPDHLHNWYPFWDTSLGKPLSPGSKRSDGSVIRSYEQGKVIYNPPGNPTIITFETPHKRHSTGEISKTHQIPSLDGDIFSPQ